jgi:hypothetical protein
VPVFEVACSVYGWFAALTGARKSTDFVSTRNVQVARTPKCRGESRSVYQSTPGGESEAAQGVGSDFNCRPAKQSCGIAL